MVEVPGGMSTAAPSGRCRRQEPCRQQELCWQKSRRSNPSGNCVELAGLPDGGVAVRNSRHPDGPVLVYTQAEFEAFIGGVRDGDFDHLLHRP